MIPSPPNRCPNKVGCSESLFMMTKTHNNYFKIDLMSSQAVLEKLGDNNSKRLHVESLQTFSSSVVLFSSTMMWFTHQRLSSVSAVQVFLPSSSNPGSAARADVL